MEKSVQSWRSPRAVMAALAKLQPSQPALFSTEAAALAWLGAELLPGAQPPLDAAPAEALAQLPAAPRGA